MPEAYERLIMDVIRGNQTLFMRGDEVEAAWAMGRPDPCAPGRQRAAAAWPYDAGSGGPIDVYELTERDGRTWREIAA